MKRYFLFLLLFIFRGLALVAQSETLILPFDATTLTDEQKASNPDFLAYPIGVAEQVPKINCNQTIDCMEFVDLGLSVKWATCNIGAEKPEDYGDYFAWGEVESKDTYDWTTYLHCKGTNKNLTKYCNRSSYGDNGFTDRKTVLDPEDDVAHVNWEVSWRMPTDKEFTELLEECKWTWINQNGVNGNKVVGPNGNSIFLPAAGYLIGSNLFGVGSYGDYWSSSLYDVNDHAYCIYFETSNAKRNYDNRSYGLTIRPVCE